MNTGKQTRAERITTASFLPIWWVNTGGSWPVSWHTDKEHYVQRRMCSLPKGENRSSTVLLTLTNRELVLLAAGQAGPSLHNDKHVFAGTTKKCHNRSTVDPVTSMMNFFPQWHVPGWNGTSLQVYSDCQRSDGRPSPQHSVHAQHWHMVASVLEELIWLQVFALSLNQNLCLHIKNVWI